VTIGRHVSVLTLLAASACSPSNSPGQRLDDLLSLVAKAEQACSIQPKTIKILVGDPYNAVFLSIPGGCPPNPIHSCLWKFKTQQGLDDKKFPITLPSGCGGVE
jgi:hypothetical protein